MGTPGLWIGFNAFILLMLALDLGVFHRRSHAISLGEATAWSVVWVVVSLAFNLGLLHWYGRTTALEFLTGYLIEKSLSVDNIFVFVLLFKYFAVEPRYQHRVLFWGILGALVMRGAMISLGVALIHRFEWVLYLFGAFLVYAGAPRRSSWCYWWWKPRTWPSPSTPFPQFSASPATRSLFTPRMSSPSLACAPFISCWQACSHT